LGGGGKAFCRRPGVTQAEHVTRNEGPIDLFGGFGLETGEKTLWDDAKTFKQKKKLRPPWEGVPDGEKNRPLIANQGDARHGRKKDSQGLLQQDMKLAERRPAGKGRRRRFSSQAANTQETLEIRDGRRGMESPFWRKVHWRPEEKKWERKT